MVFSSVTFLFAFLPITLILNVVSRGKWRNMALLLMSLVFYAWGEPIYIFLMLAMAIMNYGLSFFLQSKRKKPILILSLIINFGVLGYFKYAGFFADNINFLFGGDLAIHDLALPIGISFYTFQIVSYMIDVYRGQEKVQKNFFNLLLYITFFPQLIAGPIVKYHEVAAQIESRTITNEKFVYGVERFALGLAKKVLIANQVAIVVDTIYQNDAFSFASSWIIQILYVFQIYFDFSGYSDMAIGLGRMFGFEYLENFRQPLRSLGIRDFWRRWHISLNTWFTEYLYIPLGGSRGTKDRTIFNNFVVFFFTGFWHGASWNFIIWGIYNWFFVMLERYRIDLKKWPKPLIHIYTLFVTVVGFTPFRAEGTEALTVLSHMFNPFKSASPEATIQLQSLITPWTIFVIVIAIVLSLTPFVDKLRESKKNTLKSVIVAAIFILSLLALSTDTYNPFIYFRF